MTIRKLEIKKNLIMEQIDNKRVVPVSKTIEEGLFSTFFFELLLIPFYFKQISTSC